MSERKISWQKKRAVVRLYTQEGLSAPAIGKKLGIGSTSVYRTLEDYGVERGGDRYPEWRRRSRRFSVDQEEEITAGYKSGGSLSSLAQEFGCNLVTIRNVVLRQGGDLRARGSVRGDLTPDVIKAVGDLYLKS
jgi:transposase-like protein